MITDSEIKVGQRIKDVSVIVLSDTGGNNRRSYPSATNGRLATITEVTEKGFKYKLDERMAINTREWYDEGESYREGGYTQWEVVNDETTVPPLCGEDDEITKQCYSDIIDMKEPRLSPLPTEAELKEADELLAAYKNGEDLSVEELVKIELAGRLDNNPSPTKVGFFGLSKEQFDSIEEARKQEYGRLNLFRKCDCEEFKKRYGVTIDDQDMREGYTTCCPFCKEPFGLVDAKATFEEVSIWKDQEGHFNINDTPYQIGDNLINISEILRQIEAAGERNKVPMGGVYKAAIVLLRVIREAGADKVELLAKIMGDI